MSLETSQAEIQREKKVGGLAQTGCPRTVRQVQKTEHPYNGNTRSGGKRRNRRNI